MPAHTSTSTSKLVLTSNDRMYLNCLARAHQSQEGIFAITCDSPADMHRLRIALYRVKKKAQGSWGEEMQLDYPELHEAALDTSISITKKNVGPPWVVTIHRTDSTDFNRKLMEQLGMTREETKPQPSKSARESEQMLMELMAREGGDGEEGAASSASNNPFQSVLADKE